MVSRKKLLNGILALEFVCLCYHLNTNTKVLKVMSVQLTQAALARVKHFTASDTQALGLRFGVRKVGCSGFAYVVDIAKEQRADDRVFDIDGVKVLIDEKSLPVVQGTEIDYRREGLGSTFAFNNPNVTGECGCGESFSIDKAAI